MAFTEEKLAAKFEASEKARAAMLQAVGQAISDWAHVEEGLFAVFYELMASPSKGPPSCTFITAENLRTKIQMVDSMVRNTQSGRKVLSEWDKLQIRCNKLRIARNDLAHRKVATFTLGRGKAQPALITYSHDIRHHLKEEKFKIPSNIKIDRVKEL